MCRLFGFRSVIQSQVHSSLVSADNALATQSISHPDGWGVAYYISGAPHVVKSEQKAISDNIFKKVSGIVSSETVLAHIRKATAGNLTILNTHPFQFGPWVFAHNGNIKNLDKHKDQILRSMNPHLKRFILGETDSEIIFYFILGRLLGHINLDKRDCPIDILAQAVQEAIDELTNIIGPYSLLDQAENTETFLSFIITNGSTMLAHHGGKDLFYSTYKNRCQDRDICPSFAPECEAQTVSGFVNHLIFSSEPLSGENIWIKMSPGEILGIDWRMKLFQK